MANRQKMSQADRAKQFMPFAALRGYELALRQKERMVVPKMELSEEEQRVLDFKLHQIQKNDMVTVIYFSQDSYLKVTGMVNALDTDARVLKIVNTKIPFDDIRDLQGEQFTDWL